MSSDKDEPANGLISNRPYDELAVGDSASLSHTLTRADIDLFAIMSGDINPAHVDEEFARGDMFHHVIAHGMWGASLISTVLGTELPGPGTIYLEQTLKFRAPISPGETVIAKVTFREKADRHRVTLDCEVKTTTGTVAIEGSARVIAPTTKISRPRTELPRIRFEE
ncbi:MAG: MaoC family dehydratase N-terminal domain-containing protein [Proteobacteria bacterium]|nr:MaoC family dehydratase N-terminal domain-containing protein [Pseudomonadota bacterium]